MELNLSKILFITIVLSLYSNTLNAQTEVDSLTNLLKTEISDSTRIELLNDISYLIRKTDTTLALDYAYQAIELADIESNGIQIAEAYSNIGHIYKYANNYSKSFEFYEKSYNLKLQLIDKYSKDESFYSSLSQNLINIGNLFYFQGIYDQAVNYHLESMRYSEEHGINDKLALSLTTLGAIYKTQSKYDLALEMFFRANDIYTADSNFNELGPVLNNIGATYGDLKDYDKAAEYFNNALEINLNAGSEKSIAYCYNNLGLLNKSKGDYDSALVYFFKGLEIREKMASKYEISSSNNSIGACYVSLKNPDKALEYLEKGYSLSVEVGSIFNQREATEALSNAYFLKEDYFNAYQYHVLFKSLSDSLINIQKIEEITKLQMQYDFDAKQKIQELEQQKIDETKESELNKQKILKIGFIIGFALMLFLAIAILISLITKRKDNKLLAKQKTLITEKNYELQNQKEEILTQAEELKFINSELEKLSIVASKTDNAVVITDKDGNFEWINDGFTRLYGYTYNDLVNSNMTNIFEVSSNPDIKNVLQICINEKKSISYETYSKSKDNKNIWVQTTLTPIIDINGKIEKLIAIDSNIHKLKDAENEIRHQNEEITAQKEELQKKNERIEYQNDQIKGSIRYAQTIQSAILPLKQNIDKYLDTFIIYLPKDIVSGDFYWYSEIKSTTSKSCILAVVDCTGHGVPGAFMSMIASRLLSEIINERHITNPKNIINKLSKMTVKALKQDINENTDGMDLCICRIDIIEDNNRKITFSGAKNSLYIYQQNIQDIIVLKADRKSVGGVVNFLNKFEYTETEIILQKDDILYITTDGIVDQNNFERRRFGSPRLLSILKQNANKNLETQKELLLNNLNEWKLNEDQRDDITILGVKLK